MDSDPYLNMVSSRKHKRKYRRNAYKKKKQKGRGLIEQINPRNISNAIQIGSILYDLGKAVFKRKKKRAEVTNAVQNPTVNPLYFEVR